MKILLIGNDFFQYRKALEDSLVHLGHSVVSYSLTDSWNSTIVGKIHTKIWTFKTHLSKDEDQYYGLPENIMRDKNKEILDLYQKFNPDLFLSFAGYDLMPELLQQIQGAKKILWIYDSILKLKKIFPALKYYEKIYTFEKTDLSVFNMLGLNAEFLPLCADQRVYYPIEGLYKDIDVSFVGALTETRLKLFRELHRELPLLSMAIYGKYVGRLDIIGHACRVFHKEKKVFTNSMICPEKANELYSRSKICINLHRGQSQYGGKINTTEIL